MVGSGTDWHRRHGTARRGEAWRGLAGLVRHGAARKDVDGIGRTGLASYVRARRGTDRKGRRAKARSRKDWWGLIGRSGKAWSGPEWHGADRNGTAGIYTVRTK